MREHVRLRFAPALVALLAMLLAAGCTSGDEEVLWGVYQEPVRPGALPRAAGASELTVLWRKSLGRGAENGYAILKPAYGADGVYAASRRGIYKLDPASGATIWRREVDSDIFSGVGIGESIAAVALDNGALLAFDSASGELRWESPLGRQFSAVPVVGSGRVVARTANGMVIGLSAGAGEVVWSLERAVPGLSVHGDSAPLIEGDAVFVGLSSGKLIANNVITGREYWETEVSFAKGRNELERLTDSDAAPLIAATTLYAATYQGNVAALRLQNASVKWKTKISSRLPMSLGGGRLVVTSELGDVVALDAESGEIAWTQDGFRGRGMSRPLVLGERVVVGDSDGNIYSLDLRDGALLERRRAVSGAVVALVPGDGQFAAFSSRGQLSALRLEAAPGGLSAN